MDSKTPKLGMSSSQNKFQSIIKDSLAEIITVWEDIYGHHSVGDKLSDLEKEFEIFWKSKIDGVLEHKSELCKNISSLEKEVFKLEKILGTNSKSSNLSGTPLINIKQQLGQIVEIYRKDVNHRLEEYQVLWEKERELCTILEEQPLLETYLSSIEIDSSCTYDYEIEDIPSISVMEEAKQRVSFLEVLHEELKSNFSRLQLELKNLMEECDATPSHKVEQFCFTPHEVDFPCNKDNMNELCVFIVKFKDIKNKILSHSIYLREEISKIWKKLLKNEKELRNFFSQHNDLKQSTLKVVEDMLKSLKKERKEKIEELVLRQREALSELWDRCFISDDEKSRFTPYQSKHFSEELLELHELEVEKMYSFYEKNKRVIDLTKRHEELWQRLLHLEDLANQSERLFDNRGGQLLLEEKERNMVQKKLPAITEELISLLTAYKEANGYDFLYFGVPLIKKLKQQEEERQAAKENKKIKMKLLNAATPHGTLGSNSGTKRRPFTPVTPNVPQKDHGSRARKRLLSPPRNTNMILLTPHNPAKSTSASGNSSNISSSYESFQEQIKTRSEENGLNSTLMLKDTQNLENELDNLDLLK